MPSSKKVSTVKHSKSYGIVTRLETVLNSPIVLFIYFLNKQKNASNRFMLEIVTTQKSIRSLKEIIERTEN